MIAKQNIEEIIGIKESYQLTERLLKVLADSAEIKNVFDKFMMLERDLSYDWFTNYFQEEQGDRNALKQDYTPDCLCELIGQLQGKNNHVIADICAGTGGLTIKAWGKSKDAFFHCEELSKRAVSILLFNLAIRNVNAQVIHGDTLTGEIQSVYRLRRGEKYSDIEETDIPERIEADIVVSNPPYSLKWDSVDNFKNDLRFKDYGLPPKTKADYGFVIHALSIVKPGGYAIEILPHGVLFRGQREEQIRKSLIERKHIETVIGLPNKLFLNTGIPVLIMVLRKNRQNSDILFVDSSKEFIEGGKQNDMSSEHIKRIIDTVKNRQEIEKFSHIATIEEIQKNNYNLNIPRYVDMYEREPIPDLAETIKEIHKVDEEIHKLELEIFGMMKEMVGTTPQDEKELKQATSEYYRYIRNKYGEISEQMRLDI